MLCNDASLQVHPLKACKFTAYRCILWKLLNLQLIGLYFTAGMFLGCNLLPPWTRALPSTWRVLWIWAPPGNPWKTIKFQACSQYPQISLKVCPRSPKVTKMTPKTVPGDTKFLNKWKKWNITKIIVLTMCIAHTATGFWHHFHPRITQNMDLETVSHFGTPNYRKITKRCSKSLPRDSPNDPKITKNAHLDLQVSVGWPLGSLDHQNGVPGTQNGASR